MAWPATLLGGASHIHDAEPFFGLRTSI